MPTGPASASASVIPHRRHVYLRVQPVTLPTELVADVLEYLPLDQLWTATRVSRQFYAAAWRAGLVIHRIIICGRVAGFEASVAALRDILEHVGRKNLRLSLSVESLVPGHGRPNILPKPDDYNLPGVPEVLSLVTAALPVLVDLSVELPDCFRHQLDEALSRAAPLLRTLGMHLLLSGGPRGMHLRSNLFARTAPQLQNVSLTNVALPDQPIAAFRCVSRAHIVYEKAFLPVVFGRHFPQLTTLRMDYRAPDEDARTPESFELRGLALRKLIVDDSRSTNLLESVERSVDLSRIPHVLIIGDSSVKWIDKVWTEDSSPHSLRMSRGCNYYAAIAIIVTPAHGRWQRLLRVRELGSYEALLVIDRMPNIGTRMTYLRIDSYFVCRFLELGLELPALRDIHIDIDFDDYFLANLTPPEYNADAHVPSFHTLICKPDFVPRVLSPCPALEHITLFALNQASRDWHVLDSRGIACTAHALGQFERPAAERAVLVLVGIKFEKPVARRLLGEVVSKVRTRAFCGRGSREDFDGGLWEHEFSEEDRV